MRMAGPIATGLLSLMLVTLLLYHQQQVNQDQVNALQAEVQDLKERWYGSPMIWQPPPITNTDIRFFEVTGTTQQQLIKSLDSSKLCAKYGHCAPDPAVANGVAWGLEGADPVGSTLCYSPSTTTAEYREFVVLPKWSPPADGTVRIPLVVKWNALAKAIYTHEAGHVAISQRNLAELNNQAHQLSSCSALIAFWTDPHVFDKLTADQAGYHARLRADCRPEIGCIPAGWLGW